MSTPCVRCGRPLSDPTSITVGLGPICQSKADTEKKRGDSNAARSDYDYYIDLNGGRPVLVILDLDRGGMSVTNNAEAIVRQIASEIKDEITDDVNNMLIIYRDSSGTFDGIDMRKRGNPFYPIGTTDASLAVSMVRATAEATP